MDRIALEMETRTTKKALRKIATIIRMQKRQQKKRIRWRGKRRRKRRRRVWLCRSKRKPANRVMWTAEANKKMLALKRARTAAATRKFPPYH